MKLAEISENSKTKSEANCFATYEFENFEFLLDMTIWYNILFAINLVSKNLQSKNMHIDVVIEQLNDLLSIFEKYREYRFASTMIFFKKIIFQIKIEPKFYDKCIIYRKK